MTWDVQAGKRLVEMETVPSGPARIADVAAFAGVGVATVSRVLNGRANVAASTRERVLDAIKTLDYHPSSVARNLSLKRTLVIGVVTPFLTNPSPIERVRGIVTALGESEYDLALFDVESPGRQRRAFRLLADPHRTDGLLIVSMVPPADEVARLRNGGIATVLVDARADGLPSVLSDDVEGDILERARANRRTPRPQSRPAQGPHSLAHAVHEASACSPLRLRGRREAHGGRGADQ